MQVYILYRPREYPLAVFSELQHAIDTVRASYSPGAVFKEWREEQDYYMETDGVVYVIERFTRLCGPTRL